MTKEEKLWEKLCEEKEYIMTCIKKGFCPYCRGDIRYKLKKFTEIPYDKISGTITMSDYYDSELESFIKVASCYVCDNCGYYKIVDHTA